MRAWTDYPFTHLGDTEEAPIREIEVVSYDGDKYCQILLAGILLEEVKSCYIYQSPGRCGEAPKLSEAQLKELEQ